MKHELREVLRQALDECDIVIINGGSSKGLEDYNTKIISEYGEMISHWVKAALGRPFGMAIAENRPLINLSGPPAAAFYGRMVPASRNRQSYEPSRKTAACRLCISHGRYPCAGAIEFLCMLNLTKKRGTAHGTLPYKCTKFRKTASVGRRHARHPSGSHLVPRRTNGGR